MSYYNECGYGNGWSGSTIVLSGAILLILVLGLMCNNSWGFGGRGNAGAFAAGEIAGMRDHSWQSNCEATRQADQNTAAIQKSISDLSSRTDLQIATVIDGQKTAQIDSMRDQLNKAYMESLAKDAKIDSLQNMGVINARFDQLERNQCQLGYALSRKPNTPDFILDGGFAQAQRDCCSGCGC